jgi:hypothetical protein
MYADKQTGRQMNGRTDRRTDGGTGPKNERNIVRSFVNTLTGLSMSSFSKYTIKVRVNKMR